MNSTHSYKLKLGDYTFAGDVEINNAGVLGLTIPDNPSPSQKTKDALMQVFDILAPLEANYSDFKMFKIKLNGEEEE